MKRTRLAMTGFAQTVWGYVARALLFLALAYGSLSWAIDSGSLWLYLLTLLFIAGGVKELVVTIRTLTSKLEP